MSQSASALFEKLIAEQKQIAHEKTASESTDRVFPPGFFTKVASQDEEATSELEQFVAEALEQGYSPAEIEQVIAEGEALEAEEAGGGAEGGADYEEQEEDFDSDEASIFAQALADELKENPVAKVAGVQAEHVASFLDGESQGETYYEARAAAREVIEKIAATVIPSDDAIVESLVVLENCGYDVSSIVAEIENSMSKSASEHETPIAKAARERAERQEAIEKSAAVLEAAGFDLRKVAEAPAKVQFGPTMGDRAKSLAGNPYARGAAALAATAGTAYGAKKLYDRRKAKKQQEQAPASQAKK